MVISESVVLGVPVVSVDASGVREPFDRPRCSLIVRNTEGDLCETLRKILSNQECLQQLKDDVRQRQKNISKKRLIQEIEIFIDNLN